MWDFKGISHVFEQLRSMALDAPGVLIHSFPPWGWVRKQFEEPADSWVHKRRKECKRPRRPHLMRESFQRKVSPKLKRNPFGKHLRYLKATLQVTVIKLLLVKQWGKQTLSTCFQFNMYYWYKCTVPQEGAIGRQEAHSQTLNGHVRSSRGRWIGSQKEHVGQLFPNICQQNSSWSAVRREKIRIFSWVFHKAKLTPYGNYH